MLVYCVRHGESTYNAEERLQGRADVPLSELGRRQARATACALAGEPIEAVYASPLRRALETAQVVAEARGLHVEILPDLSELDVGIFQDQRRCDLERLHPEAMRRWTSGDPDYVIPGGESRRDLMRRGLAAFEAIRRAGRAPVVVVSHGGLLAGALKALLEIPAARHPFALENASISKLWLKGDRVMLLALGVVEHLREVGLAGLGDLNT